jgi:uncharacterized YccA/Bax inhibitor family protein
MAISHNPIFNRSMKTAELVEAQERSQAAVDAEFEKLTSRTPMTVEGTAGKVLALFALVVATGFATVFAINAGLINESNFYGVLIGSALVGAVLMWVAALSSKVRKGVMLAYALVEGVFLGAISFLFEAMYPGIVQNAVLATLATAGSMFAAYRFGWVKVNARFTKVMAFALVGYFIFGLVNLAVSLFSNNAGIYSTPFAWIAGLIGAGLAAFSLNLDFEAISQGAKQQLARENEWRAAFGLTTTLIWLYVEILRLLAILNRR